MRIVALALGMTACAPQSDVEPVPTLAFTAPELLEPEQAAYGCDDAPICDPVSGTPRRARALYVYGGFGTIGDLPGQAGAVVIDTPQDKLAWAALHPEIRTLDLSRERALIAWRERRSTCGLGTVDLQVTEAADGTWHVEVVQVNASQGCPLVCDAGGQTVGAWILETTAPVEPCLTVVGDRCCDSDWR